MRSLEKNGDLGKAAASDAAEFIDFRKEKKKMQNRAIDVHNALMAELERLGDEELKGDDLAQEIKKADAISKIAGQVINNGKLVLDAIRLSEEYSGVELPEMLTTKVKQIGAPETAGRIRK